MILVEMYYLSFLLDSFLGKMCLGRWERMELFVLK